MIRLSESAVSQIYLLILLTFCAAGLQGCIPNSNNSNNLNSSSSEDVKTYSRWIEAPILIDPPPTDGPDGKHLRVGEVQSQLKISSLKQAAIVLTPQKNSITVESIELAIYSGDNKEKLFSLQASAASNRRTFDSVDRQSDSTIAGYVFNLDSQRIDEADKFFVPENTIKITPAFRRDKAVTATLYLVDKQSEVTKKN